VRCSHPVNPFGWRTVEPLMSANRGVTVLRAPSIVAASSDSDGVSDILDGSGLAAAGLSAERRHDCRTRRASSRCRRRPRSATRGCYRARVAGTGLAHRPTNRLILSPQIVPLLPNLRIVRRIARLRERPWQHGWPQ
jgi:hypothetical protein